MRLGIGVLKTVRHHAEDRETSPIEDEALAQDIGPSTEVLLPHCVTQHDGRIGPGRLFSQFERPTDSRANTEHRQDGGR